MNNAMTFAEFESHAHSQGYPDVLERHWQADTVVATHSHPFDASAVVVQGEMWLTVGEATQHITRGGTFAVPRNTLHAERYGPQGAIFWVGRRAG